MSSFGVFNILSFGPFFFFCSRFLVDDDSEVLVEPNVKYKTKFQ